MSTGHSHPDETAARALDTRERVRRSLDGVDLLPTAVEDSCTWYGYLSVVLCRIDATADEGHRPGR